MKTKYHRRLTLVGLTGYAGTGKDAVRAILQESGFNGFAFADPIRTMLNQLLTSNGIDPAWMNERNKKEEIIPALGVSYRHMAQTLGTEWGRGLQGDFWLRIADSYLNDLTWDSTLTHFVVSDVRFENEAEWVRERGGVIWRIHRPLAEPVRGHASESGIDRIAPDLTIQNTGTMEDLKEAVFGALQVLA